MATPPTVILAEDTDLAKAKDELGFPLVVKIPDGSFSRGVHKVDNDEALKRVAEELLEESDLSCAEIRADRIRLARRRARRRPLFVCQYRMARGHWQMVKYRPDGPSMKAASDVRARQGAGRSRRYRGAGGAPDRGRLLRGRHQGTSDGPVVIEVNDNPNLEHGIEDQVGKDEIWIRLLKWFIERFEQ